MDYPPFQDAVSRLVTFLRHCGVPSNIRWVGFPDVAWVRARLYVRQRPAELAFSAAQAKYERAIPRRLGVKLAALCRSGAVSYCYVHRPSNLVEAEYALMPDGLKLWVPVPLPEAGVVVSEAEWECLRGQDCDLRHKRRLLS
jgi:hypothetical protein